MKTIKQIEEANYLSTSDIADYFCHYRNWMKSGIGDLLKGTWKAPVAGAVRGNLKDADLLKKFDIHGPCYLSGGGCFPSIYNELKNY